MYYCGLDLHAKSSTYCVVDRRGRRVREGEVATGRRGFGELADRFEGKSVRLVVEPSTRSRWAAKELERLGFEVVTVDPRKIRVIAETKHKTDRMDARVLADLLRTGALPTPLWSASESTCELRDQVRLRWCPVRQRSSLQLRARSMLAAHGVTLGKRALASQATWARVLKQREVPVAMRQLLTTVHTAIAALDRAIEEVERACAPRLADPVVERMCAMPGVGPVVALTTVAALGDPKRFRDSRHAAAYTDLTPSEHSSGKRRRRGHATKQGPSELRRVWIQAAQAALRMRAHPLKAWAQRLIYRRGRAVAVVAVARRMFRWAFAMWREQKPFDPRLAIATR